MVANSVSGLSVLRTRNGAAALARCIAMRGYGLKVAKSGRHPSRPRFHRTLLLTHISLIPSRHSVNPPCNRPLRSAHRPSPKIYRTGISVTSALAFHQQRSRPSPALSPSSPIYTRLPQPNIQSLSFAARHVQAILALSSLFPL
jgi:hypothetical protein